MLPRCVALTALAVLSSLFTVGNASAQQGLPFSRQGQYIYRELERYQSPTYSTPNYYVAPTPVVPAAVVPAITTDSNVSRSYYPLLEQHVLINVNVPADAKIIFQGMMTKQTGTQRSFESPPIDPRLAYTYEVQARWMENGKEISQSRRIPVLAGEVLNLTFTRDGVDVRRSN